MVESSSLTTTTPDAVFRTSASRRRPANLVVAIVMTMLAIFSSAFVISGSVIMLATGAQPYFAILRVVVGLLILAYILFYAWRSQQEEATEHELEFFADEVILKVRGPGRRHVQTGMDYAEMDFVEYFTTCDRESFVFHARSGRIIEVPMWKMEPAAKFALPILERQGVRIERL